jgi:large subunit ribosomal protein L5
LNSLEREELTTKTETEAERENPMREIRIEKVTVNIAVGKSGDPLEKAKKVLQQITEHTPCQRNAKRTVKDWGIRKGEPIACIVTLRGEECESFLKRAIEAVGNKIPESSFDDYGNFSFGIKEHIDIPGTKYVPEIGIFGMNVNVTLERRGYRIKRRAMRTSQIGKKHVISKQEAMGFSASKLQANIVREGVTSGETEA